MIKINTKKDPLLAKDFPSDPYSNLNIITSTQTFNLQQAFLAMDSDYFAKLDPEINQIDLSELKQDPLQKVLKSLYGEELHANSISELVQLYHIIKFLEIQDYKQNIVQQIQQRKDILQSLQLLELSYKQKLCWDKVLEIHVQSKLKMLQDNKNYLQLSKISNETFDLLLTTFLKRYGESESKILNNVMQNYFNRKNIKPMTYLKNPALSKLQAVWLKFHHVPMTEMNNPIAPTINSLPFVYMDQAAQKYQKELPLLKSSEYDQSVENKRKRVIELEKQIIYKDNIILELTQQIDEIKRQIGLKPEITKAATVKSLLIEVQNGEKDRGTKKKRLEDLLGERHKDKESVVGQDNKPQTRPKEPEPTEIKALHRLGSKNIKKV